MLRIETSVETGHSGYASCPTVPGLYSDRTGDLWCVDKRGIIIFIYRPSDKSFVSPHNLKDFVLGSQSYGPFHGYTGTLSFSNSV